MSQVADMSSVTPDLRHQRVRLHKDRVGFFFVFLKDPDGKHREITTKVLAFYLDPRNFTLTIFMQLNCYSSTEYNPL